MSEVSRRGQATGPTDRPRRRARPGSLPPRALCSHSALCLVFASHCLSFGFFISCLSSPALCVFPSPASRAMLPMRLCPSLSGLPRVTSQGIATGKYHAAVLTNSAEWEAACVKAGRKCGDLVHPLVYCPELHFSEFTSAVADMKNSVAVGLARPPHPVVQNKLGPALRESVSP